MEVPTSSRLKMKVTSRRMRAELSGVPEVALVRIRSSIMRPSKAQAKKNTAAEPLNQQLLLFRIKRRMRRAEADREGEGGVWVPGWQLVATSGGRSGPRPRVASRLCAVSPSSHRVRTASQWRTPSSSAASGVIRSATH